MNKIKKVQQIKILNEDDGSFEILNDRYRVTHGDEDTISFVPINSANKDYVEIMRQVEAGTLTIAPADEE